MFKNKFWMKIAIPVNNCLIDLNYFFFSSIYISVTDLTQYLGEKIRFKLFSSQASTSRKQSNFTRTWTKSTGSQQKIRKKYKFMSPEFILDVQCGCSCSYISVFLSVCPEWIQRRGRKTQYLQILIYCVIKCAFSAREGRRGKLEPAKLRGK